MIDRFSSLISASLSNKNTTFCALVQANLLNSVFFRAKTMKLELFVLILQVELHKAQCTEKANVIIKNIN